MATVEEAMKCPKCGNTGVELHRTHIRPKRGPLGIPETSGGTLRTIQCQTKLCRWYEQTYVIQVRPDNTVPDPDLRPRQKQYPPMATNEQAKNMTEAASKLLQQSVEEGRNYRR
jgi:endogenous inhibitor of DNA gyrase (YacG/DUF329 family)